MKPYRLVCIVAWRHGRKRRWKRQDSPQLPYIYTNVQIVISQKRWISYRVSSSGPTFLTFHSTALDFRQAIFKCDHQLLAWALQYIGCNLTLGCSQTCAFVCSVSVSVCVCVCLCVCVCILLKFCEGFLTFLFYTHRVTRILFTAAIFHSNLT